MYLHPFRNNYPDHDFALIANTVKEYFPTGKEKRLTSETVAASQGFKKIGDIAGREFMNQKAYQDKWGKLISHLKKIFKKTVSGYPDLSGGGFFGEVIIEEVESPDFIRQKTLQFHVSIIGPFFSIQGVDSSMALLEIESWTSNAEKGHFDAKHAVTISPVFEYQEVFSRLESELRTFFPEYRFVPFEIGMSTMGKISIADDTQDYDPRMMDTIYEALFGRNAVHNCLTRGDMRYGLNDWLKPLNKKEQALLHTISKNIEAASTGVTVHKVWKLQDSKQLDTFTRSGNLMFGMDVFDIIDLTDTSTVIMTSDKRGAPGSAKYTIKDNDVIEIAHSYSLRIVELSQESLTLNVILNFSNSGVSLNGEVLEMHFSQLKRMDAL
jgi:hypothetical protein